MLKKKLISLALLLALVLIFPKGIYGQDCSQSSDPVQCFQDSIDKLQSTKTTLSNQIQLINSQISLTSLKITQTQASIKSTQKEIADLTIKIGQLDLSLNQLSNLYIQQVAQNYKLSKRYNPFSIFLTTNFNHVLEQYKYISEVQKDSQNTLVNLETVRAQDDQQKTEKTTKQQQLTDLQSKLAVQQNTLSSQNIVKKNTLALTQKQLDDAIAQLNELRNFSNSNGPMCLTNSPGGGDGGWFYSQRDPKWCNQYIGYSKDTIGEVGCFIASVAMIWKKYGFDMSPSMYAARPDHFAGSTAWMLAPEVPPGFGSQVASGYNKSFLDNALSNGHPIIVQLYMRGSSSGMHFIVIKSGSNGNYKMNDPWFGADLNFSDHYSLGSIMSLRLISK